MELEKFIRNSNDFQFLKKEIESGNISKSILLLSKDSTYSFEFAKILACEIFSNGKGEDENYLKVKADAHPDLKIYPTKDKLVVADSQEIVMESYIKPIFSDKKIFVIKNFETANESAQNKLLKILEEPPRNVYFILTSSSETLVLPTIKSRCNKIQLAKMKKEDVEEIFKNHENAELISAISDGLIGKGEILARKKNLKEIFDSILSVVTDLKASKDIILYSNKVLSTKEDLSFVFEIYSLIMEEILSIKLNGKSLRFESCFLKLKEVEKDYSVKAICEIQNYISSASKELFYSGNQSLIFENFLLNVLEVKYLCK